MKKKKVMTAMSGGVDSSVAAYLLCSQGYECGGITMKLFGNEMISLSGEHTCCSERDTEDARKVAQRLGMPFYIYDFSPLFRKNVVDRFVRAYEQGQTPNPCVDCNRYMKFGLL